MSEAKLKQIDENSADVSPASIHRKDSYRRAQEQKLFLDSSELNSLGKHNRLTAGRKVKTIFNGDAIRQPPNQSQSQTQLMPSPNSFMENNHQENQLKVLKIGNNFRNNFIPEEVFKNKIKK